MTKVGARWRREQDANRARDARCATWAEAHEANEHDKRPAPTFGCPVCSKKETR